MAAKLRAPAWYRAALFIAARRRLLARARRRRPRRATALEPSTADDGDAILTSSLIAAPLFFLVGLGAFDYWFYWAAGRPTRPEDHSRHGADAGRTTSGSTPTTR